jgi:hypothetical protein
VIDVAAESASKRGPAESKNPRGGAGGHKTTNRISPFIGVGDSCQGLLYGVGPQRGRRHGVRPGAKRIATARVTGASTIPAGAPSH